MIEISTKKIHRNRRHARTAFCGVRRPGRPEARLKRDADGLTRAERLEMMLDLLMICRHEVGVAGKETPLTMEQIAAFLGVTFQAVQQTEYRALAKLRSEVARRGLTKRMVLGRIPRG